MSVRRDPPSNYLKGFTSQEKGKLFFVRHGNTRLNSNEKLRGWLPIPLDEQGRADARRLGKDLSSKGIDVIVSSDLGRAHDTASEIAKASGLKVTEASKDFRPWNLGDLAGKSVKETLPILAEYADDKPDEDVPGGESFNTFKTRFLKALQSIPGKYPGKNVALVAHHRNDRLIQGWLKKDGPANPDVDMKTFLQKGIEPGTYTIVPFSDITG